MGSDIDDTVQIPDPEDPTKFLTGSQARMEIARKSFMTTGFAPSGFDQAMRAFGSATQSEIAAGEGGSNGSNGYIETSRGSVPHGTQGYESNPDAPVYNNANRVIALESEMTEDEKAEFRRKADELLNKANFDVSDSSTLTGGISINFNTNTKGQDLTNLGFPIYFSGSYIERDGKISYQKREIDKTLLGSGTKIAFPSAALIELLSRVTDKIYISGGFGKGRGIIGGNHAELTAQNSYVTDHAFARAFDIDVVGDIDLNERPQSQVYLNALKNLLNQIEALPQELHPDQVGISSDLANQLNIIDGLEAANAEIRKMHPNLAKFVSFGADSAHKDHIHISYGSERAGAYLPPFDESLNQVDDLPPYVAGGDVGVPVTNPSSLLEKFKKSYKTNTAPFGEGSLTQIEIFHLLNYYGNFGPELSAIFAEIAFRESSCNPWSYNDDGFIGLWQIGTRITSGSGGTLRPIFTVPVTETIENWKMAYTPWKFFGLDKKTDAEKDAWIRNQQLNDASGNVGRANVDPRAFIPLNQVAVLRAKFARPDIANDEIVFIGDRMSQSVLYAWGEKFLVHSWIGDLSFERLKTIYQQGTGKDGNLIGDWILRYINKDSTSLVIDPETGKSKLQSWIEGKIYSGTYV